MNSGGTLRRLAPQLPRIAAVFLLTGLPLALADSAPPLPTASTEIAFTCTDATGNVLGCTNLPASCSEWYPKCVKRLQNGPKSIPGNCSSASFTLVKYVGAPPPSDAADNAQGAASAVASPPPSVSEFAQASSSPAPGFSPVVSASAPAAPPPAAAALPGVPNAASFYQAALSLAAGANQPAVPAQKEGALETTLNFSDPWMDYVSNDSRKELVIRLKGDPKLREDIRAKINASASDQTAADPNAREKIEYFRQALAEAEFISHRGSLDSLTPLNTQETFAVNGNEEIRRLVSSMREAEGGEAPLFPRVHRALWRQLAIGNIHLVARGKPAK